MNDFSFNDCKLLWDSRIKVPKYKRKKIKSEVKRFNGIIGKALIFLKESTQFPAPQPVVMLYFDNADYTLSLETENWDKDEFDFM